MQSDYIRTARAFGMPASTVRRYALRNILDRSSPWSP